MSTPSRKVKESSSELQYSSRTACRRHTPSLDALERGCGSKSVPTAAGTYLHSYMHSYMHPD